MKELSEYLAEGFYNNVGNAVHALLGDMVKKGKDTTPDDVYVYINNFADYCIGNKLIKPIKVKGYRFDKYPGIYINYIHTPEIRKPGYESNGGVVMRLFNSNRCWEDKVCINDFLDISVTGWMTRGVAHPGAKIDLRHGINYYTKSYINGLCTDPSVSHFYYISDSDFVNAINTWFEKTPAIYGGKCNDDQLMDSVPASFSFDSLN